ncbi:YoaK family protein [Salinibacterium sp. ZJ450]|uniref:YoaK family protein n=1 Tax=Salinibacterium sp. ZJ450 TaxID=2708338 RepID=UPI0014226E99|nr:YoaK family protein [Salinibacterium sp. ZJ450]
MSPHHVRKYTTGLLLLTASTGAFDAVSYLALDRVFTGNMTGNVLFLGFAAIGIEGIPFLNNLVALAGFIVGSMVSGRIIGHGEDDGTLPRSAAWVLGYGAAIAIMLAVVWLLIGELPEPALLAITFLLAAVMGGQVSAVKPIGNSEITTIVVTNTVANLARDSRLGGGRNQPWVQRLLAVVAMGLGAVVGAGVIGWLGGPAAMVASVAVYLAGAFTIVVTSRSARQRRGAAAA